MARGRFVGLPALRLNGTAGPRRAATPQEQQRWQRRVRPVRRLKGCQLLWGDLGHVRDLVFETALMVDLGPMTQHLGSGSPEL